MVVGGGFVSLVSIMTELALFANTLQGQTLTIHPLPGIRKKKGEKSRI